MNRLGSITMLGMLALGVTLGSTQGEVRGHLPVDAPTAHVEKPTPAAPAADQIELAAYHPATVQARATGGGGGSAQQKPCGVKTHNRFVHTSGISRFWPQTLASDTPLRMKVVDNIYYRVCDPNSGRTRIKPYQSVGCYDWLTDPSGFAIMFRGVDVNGYVWDRGGVNVNPGAFHVDKHGDHHCETHAISKDKQAWLYVRGPDGEKDWAKARSATKIELLFPEPDIHGSTGPRAIHPKTDPHA